MAEQPPPHPPPALMDELVEEILLRVPPDDPACLARAAVVYKHWFRLVTDPGFRRRFRQFHRAPPMLGFMVNPDSCGTHFLPTSSFRPRSAVANFDSYPLLDARHGRALLCYRYNDEYDDPNYYDFGSANVAAKDLICWVPATDEMSRLPNLWLPHSCYGTLAMAAALLCTEPGCDHMECECPSYGNLSVILVLGDNLRRFTYAYDYVYSTDCSDWSETAATIELPGLAVQSCTRGALARDALYFLLEDNKGILEYNLSKKELSATELPPICNESTGGIVLMAVEERDGLGFAMVNDDFSLCIWFRDSALTPSGVWTWTQHRVVDIKSFLSVSPLPSSLYIIAAAANDFGVFVIWAKDAGVLAIDLKTSRVTKVYDGDYFVKVIPYISFCTPSGYLAKDDFDELLMSGEADVVASHEESSKISVEKS